VVRGRALTDYDQIAPEHLLGDELIPWHSPECAVRADADVLLGLPQRTRVSLVAAPLP